MVSVCLGWREVCRGNVDVEIRTDSLFAKQPTKLWWGDEM